MKRGKLKINWKLLVLCLVIVYSVAFIGSLFTIQGTNSEWYQSIKPSITPPNWVFPIVWNILFFLIALSLYFVTTSSKNKQMKTKVYVVFGINFLLNILWSLFYFSMKNPALAFIDLIILLGSIISMIFISFKVSRKSSWLLVPYLLWVSFAGILNYLSAFA
ncbi:MAG: TspO/MBR family protein [Nanoarchaeota archaeon]